MVNLFNYIRGFRYSSSIRNKLKSYITYDDKTSKWLVWISMYDVVTEFDKCICRDWDYSEVERVATYFHEEDANLFNSVIDIRDI